MSFSHQRCEVMAIIKLLFWHYCSSAARTAHAEALCCVCKGSDAKCCVVAPLPRSSSPPPHWRWWCLTPCYTEYSFKWCCQTWRRHERKVGHGTFLPVSTQNCCVLRLEVKQLSHNQTFGQGLWFPKLSVSDSGIILNSLFILLREKCFHFKP